MGGLVLLEQGRYARAAASGFAVTLALTTDALILSGSHPGVQQATRPSRAATVFGAQRVAQHQNDRIWFCLWLRAPWFGPRCQARKSPGGSHGGGEDKVTPMQIANQSKEPSCLNPRCP